MLFFDYLKVAVSKKCQLDTLWNDELGNMFINRFRKFLNDEEWNTRKNLTQPRYNEYLDEGHECLWNMESVPI